MTREFVEKNLRLVDEYHNPFPKNHYLYREVKTFEILDPIITSKDIDAARGETWFCLNRDYFTKDGKRFFREEWTND